MDREIKFRAWDKSDKEMYHNIINGIEFDDGSKYDFCRFLGNKEIGDYHEWVVMQYTGIKDIDGVDIYEGDIIDCECTENQKEQNGKREVVWNNSEMSWGTYEGDSIKLLGLCMNWGGFDTFRVLGNIHQNPDLLKS